MIRHKLSMAKVLMLRQHVKNAPFDWRDIDFTLGRCQRQDGTWRFWLKDGRRVAIEFMIDAIITRVTTSPDVDRPRLIIQNVTKMSLEWYHQQLQKIEAIR